MKNCVQRYVLVFLCALSLVFTGFNIAANPLGDNKKDKKAEKPKAAEFVLKDQFGKELTYKFPKDKVSLLAFADKDGSDQLDAWIRPLYDKYTDKIDILGVAELTAVPGIAKGIVRGMIKKKSPKSVGLDWDGKVSKSYDYQKKQANIILIDKDGNIILKEIGAVDNTKLEKFYKEIDELLK